MASELPDSYRIDFVIALSKALVTFEQPIESSVKSRIILSEIIAALLDQLNIEVLLNLPPVVKKLRLNQIPN